MTIYTPPPPRYPVNLTNQLVDCSTNNQLVDHCDPFLVFRQLHAHAFWAF